MVKKTLILILISLLINSIGFSQQYNFKNYSLAEGLPQSEIHAIMQDKRGSIWLGTNGGGLCRFNGQDFDVYTVEDGLASNIIQSLFEDSHGNLWVTTMCGVSKYDGIKFTTYSEKFGNSNGYCNGFFSKIFDDKNGKLWFFVALNYNNNRILFFENDKFIDFTSLHPELTKDNFVFYMFKDNKGNFLFPTDKNILYEYDGNKFKISDLSHKVQFNNKIIFPLFEDTNNLWLFVNDTILNKKMFCSYHNGVFTDLKLPFRVFEKGYPIILKDKKNNFWGFKNRDLVKYDGQKHELITKNNGLIDSDLQCLYEDREGNKWIGTRGAGLVKYSDDRIIAYNKNDGLKYELITFINEDSKNNYWFCSGTDEIVKLGSDGKLIRFSDKNGDVISIFMLVELENNKLLLASNKGLFTFYNGIFKKVNKEYGLDGNQSIVYILKDNNDFWFSTYRNGILKYSNGVITSYNQEKDNLKSNSVHRIFKDSKSNIWFSTALGLSKFDGNRIVNYNEKDGLSNNLILQVAEDKFGYLWIATYGVGIDRFDGSKFRNYGKKDGLSSNIVYSVIADRLGNLWAGTQLGIDKISFKKNGEIEKIKHYGKPEGFSGIETNGGANYIDKKGNLWFGTIKGVMKYNPSSDTPNTTPPNTNITNIRLFFNEVQWKDAEYKKYYSHISPWFLLPVDLKLPYRYKHITFDFEALSYVAPERIKYQYKLEGFDEDWSPVSNKTEAIYTNLPSGKYKFKVKACNNDGVWNEKPTTYNFEILVPFWETWWFRAILVILIIVFVYFYFKRRIKIVEAKKLELEKLIDKKTIEVRKQNAEILAKNAELEQQKEEIIIQAENLKQSYENLALLNEIGKTITSNLSVETIINIVYEKVNTLMEANAFGIGIYNKETDAIEFPGVKENGNRMNFVSYPLNDNLRLPVFCFKTQREVFINDYQNEYKDYFPELIPPSVGNFTLSIMYVPLCIHKRAIGVITVQSFKSYAYTKYHLYLLRNIAVYTNIALDNANAYQQIAEKTKNLQIANQNIIRQKEQIETKNNELIKLNDEKNHLLGVVAHDLRNPLTSSITIANVLKMEREEDSESADYLINALNRMNEMINRILDVRAIETKSNNLIFRKFDFINMMQQVVNQLNQKAVNKRQTIITEFPVKMEMQCLLDESYTKHIFENLISNAIKFSPFGKDIIIRLFLTDNKIKTEIKDNGPGISTDDMKKLFGKYQKLSAKPTGDEISTGLGLSIVKRFVEALKGKVWCESKLNEGTSFFVEFSV